MEKLTKKTIDDILKHTQENDAEILRSNQCSCLFCRHTFDARKVSEWIDVPGHGMAAICPECGIDAVVGDASGYTFTKEELRTINKKVFGGNYMEGHPQALQVYVDRYKSGKISHKPENEALYLEYLRELYRREEPKAAFLLGEFYQYGSEFTEPRLSSAEIYFSSPVLADDHEALDHLGLVHLEGPTGRKEYKKAFLCFTKSALAGDFFGMNHLIDCYLKGIYVKQDIQYVGRVIMERFPEIYRTFVFERRENSGIHFGFFAKRMAEFFLVAFPENDRTRLEIAHSLLLQAISAMNDYFEDHDPNASRFFHKEFEEITSLNAELENELGIKRGDPLLDQDTFFDSYRLNFQSPGIPEYAAEILDAEFDEEEHTLVFTMRYKKEPFLVDSVNCFCDFAPLEVTWNFREVQKAEIACNKPFEIIQTHGNDSIRFFHRSEKTGELVLVGEIQMIPMKDGEEEWEEEPSESSKTW